MDDVIGQRAWNKLAAHRQCSATAKQTGERRKRAPIVGGFVCDMHGGATPAVKQSARERLLAMVDPALDTLLRALQTGPPCTGCGHVNDQGEACVGCGRRDGDRHPVVLRAAQLVLDRAGFHPTMQLEVQSAPNPYTNLSLSELADRAEAFAREARRLADDEATRLLPETVEGSLVPNENDAPSTVTSNDTATDSTPRIEPIQHATPHIPVGNTIPEKNNGGK